MQLLTYSLAIWRLYRLLAFDAGPFDSLAKMRWAAGVRTDAAAKSYGTTSFSEGLLCRYCAPVWYSLILFGLRFIAPRLADSIALVLAAAGGATLIEEVLRGQGK